MLLQPAGGGGCASGEEQRAGGVVELDDGLVSELAGVAVEGNGVGDFLGALREQPAGEEDVGDVAGGVGAVRGQGPCAETGAALAYEEAWVGGGFGERAAAREEEYGGERRTLDAGGAVVLGDGDPPCSGEASGRLVGLGAGCGCEGDR